MSPTEETALHLQFAQEDLAITLERLTTIGPELNLARIAKLRELSAKHLAEKTEMIDRQASERAQLTQALNVDHAKRKAALANDAKCERERAANLKARLAILQAQDSLALRRHNRG